MANLRERHRRREDAFRAYYDDRKDALDRAGEVLESLLRRLLRGQPSLSNVTILRRVKDREECLRKFKRKYMGGLLAADADYAIQDYISDLVGLRVICRYKSEIPRIRALLAWEFQVLGTTDKTALLEESESGFGYAGLHLDLKLKESTENLSAFRRAQGIPFEVQIRTVIQDAWSVLDHGIKYKRSIPRDLKRRINALAALFEIADREFESIRDLSGKLERRASVRAVGVTEAVLDVFTFQTIFSEAFPGSVPSPRSADRFVHDILQRQPWLSGQTFQTLLNRSLETVNRFEDAIVVQGERPLSDTSKVRHALYLSDRDLFGNLLWRHKAEKLDGWLKKQESIVTAPEQSKRKSGSGESHGRKKR